MSFGEANDKSKFQATEKAAPVPPKSRSATRESLDLAPPPLSEGLASGTTINIVYDGSRSWSENQFSVLPDAFCRPCWKIIAHVVQANQKTIFEGAFCRTCRETIRTWKDVIEPTKLRSTANFTLSSRTTASGSRTTQDQNSGSSVQKKIAAQSASKDNISYEEVAVMVNTADSGLLRATVLELCGLSPALRYSVRTLLRAPSQQIAGSSRTHFPPTAISERCKTTQTGSSRNLVKSTSQIPIPADIVNLVEDDSDLEEVGLLVLGDNRNSSSQSRTISAESTSSGNLNPIKSENGKTPELKDRKRLQADTHTEYVIYKKRKFP